MIGIYLVNLFIGLFGYFFVDPCFLWVPVAVGFLVLILIPFFYILNGEFIDD